MPTMLMLILILMLMPLPACLPACLAAPCPPRRVLVPMTPSRPSVTKGKFSLLSYNMLADLYATVRRALTWRGVLTWRGADLAGC